MQKVKCGAQGLVVSRLGLGCMSMSSTYGPADEVEAGKALQASLEAEMSFWDTADVYGGGANERFIAPFLSGRREQIVVDVSLTGLGVLSCGCACLSMGVDLV